LPPIWVEKIEAIEDDISKIQVKMRELSALHTKRLMVNFETDEQQQEREIDHKTHQITDIFRHAEGLLKTFSKQANDSTLSASERKVRENMQRSIGKKLQGFTMKFRQSQKEYLNRKLKRMEAVRKHLDFWMNQKNQQLILWKLTLVSPLLKCKYWMKQKKLSIKGMKKLLVLQSLLKNLLKYLKN
jgi:hypothetical protein